MRVEDWKNAAEARLFNLICDAIEPLLEEHAPLYSVAQVGIGNEFDTGEILLKIRLRQQGSVRLRAKSDPVIQAVALTRKEDSDIA